MTLNDYGEIEVKAGEDETNNGKAAWTSFQDS